MMDTVQAHQESGPWQGLDITDTMVREAHAMTLRAQSLEGKLVNSDLRVIKRALDEDGLFQEAMEGLLDMDGPAEERRLWAHLAARLRLEVVEEVALLRSKKRYLRRRR